MVRFISSSGLKMLRAQRSENSAASTITSRKMPTIMASIVYLTSRNGCSR